MRRARSIDEVLFFGGKGGVGQDDMRRRRRRSRRAALGKRVLLVSTDPGALHLRHLRARRSARARRGAAVAARDGNRRRHRVAPLRRKRQGAHRGSCSVTRFCKEANRQIDLAATMPGAEEVALFDRMGALIRGEDERFDLIVFDTAPTGHTLRLIRMPELMEAWIARCRGRAARCWASIRTTRTIRS